MRAYFDLYSEEFDLWRAGYIENRVWQNWKRGIEFAFSKKAFQDGWNIISLYTIYYPEFSKWINELVEKQTVNSEKFALKKIKEKKEACH